MGQSTLPQVRNENHHLYNYTVTIKLTWPFFTAGIDFSMDNHTVTFVASSTSGRLCVNIDILSDDIDEFNEQFLVRFGNLPNAQAQLGPIPETCITIVDDDG